MAPLCLCHTGLTLEVQEKAEKELGETPSVRENALKKFKQLLCEQQDINSRMDDVFLLRFLRGKKYDLQKALKVLRNYYTLRTKYRGQYTGKTPSELKHVLQMRYIFISPQRIPPGAHIVILRLGRFDLQKASTDELLSCIAFQGEICQDYELSQVCGGEYIVDFKDTTYSHYTQFMTISIASVIINVLQDGWPERFVGIHFVNEPFLLHSFLNCIKIFMRKKLRERIHLHGNNVTTLHAHIPKDLLPEDLGGTAGPYDDKEYVDFFLGYESYFEKINKYGIVEQPSI